MTEYCWGKVLPLIGFEGKGVLGGASWKLRGLWAAEGSFRWSRGLGNPTRLSVCESRLRLWPESKSP